MAFPLLALLSTVASQKQKKDQEQEQRRDAAARGEAMAYPGAASGGQGASLLGAAAPFLQQENKERTAMDDVDESLDSYDRYGGYTG